MKYTNVRIVTGFILSLIILILLGYYSYHNNQNFIRTRQLIFHTTRVIFHIEQTQSNALKIEELMARYVVSGDSTLLDRYAKELEDATNHHLNLQKLTKDKPEQQARMDSIAMVGRKKIIAFKNLIELRSESKAMAEESFISANYQQLNERINELLSRLRDGENNLLNQRIAISAIEVQQFQFTFFTLMGVMILILVGVLIIVNRSFQARAIAEEKTNLVNKELEAFTYSVSHDLRAPLRSIRGFSQMLLKDYAPQLDEEGNRLLSRVIHNANQMGQLIDDLLDFSRIGRKELFISRINTKNQVMEVINEITDHEQMRKQQIHLAALPEMKGDQNMLKLVWANLISNALKYSRDKEDPKIEIGGKTENGRAVFYIKDNGVGFDMKYSDKLFNVFQRLHNKATFEGTGVGLALVHRIVSRHNGVTWVEAKVDEGATFYFSIPN